MFVVLVVLAVRVFWTAAGTETGFPFLRQQWQRATVGWIVDTEPISAKTPREQADFWLAESRRVLDENASASPHRRALLAMGAAQTLRLLSLSDPGQSSRDRYLSDNLPNWFSASVDFEVYFQVDKERESVLKEWQRLEDQAIAWEPDNPDWRRLRALTAQEQPREEALQVLRECAASDPGNGLYELIALAGMVDDVFETMWHNGKLKTIVIDETRLPEFWDSFDRLEACERIEDGNASWPAINTFLEASDTDPKLRAQLLIAHSSRIFGFDPAAKVTDALATYSRTLVDQGRTQQAFEIRRALLRLYDKNLPNPSLAGNDLEILFLSLYAENAISLIDDNSSVFSAAQRREIQDFAYRARVEYLIDIETAARCEETIDGYSRTPRTQWRDGEALFALALMAPEWICELFVLGLSASAAAWACRRKNPARHDNPDSDSERTVAAAPTRALGWLGTSVIWGLSGGLSFVVWGLMSACNINESHQHHLITVVALATPLFLAILICVRILRRNKYRFSLRAMFVVTTLAALTTMAAIEVAFLYGKDTLPLQIEIESTRVAGVPNISYWNTVDPDSWRVAMAILQWVAQPGFVTMLIGWSVLVAIAYPLTVRRRLQKQHRQVEANSGSMPPQPKRSWRDGLRGLALSYRRGAWALAVLLLAFWAWLTPELLTTPDLQFQHARNIYWDYPAHLALRQQLDEEIRNDPQEMKDIDAWARAFAKMQ